MCRSGGISRRVLEEAWVRLAVIAAATEAPRGERAHAVGGAENAIVWLGRLGIRYMAHVVIMTHGTRLLNAAHYADEYLIFQIKRTIG